MTFIDRRHFELGDSLGHMLQRLPPTPPPSLVSSWGEFHKVTQLRIWCDFCMRTWETSPASPYLHETCAYWDPVWRDSIIDWLWELRMPAPLGRDSQPSTHNCTAARCRVTRDHAPNLTLQEHVCLDHESNHPGGKQGYGDKGHPRHTPVLLFQIHRKVTWGPVHQLVEAAVLLLRLYFLLRFCMGGEPLSRLCLFLITKALLCHQWSHHQLLQSSLMILQKGSYPPSLPASLPSLRPSAQFSHQRSPWKASVALYMKEANNVICTGRLRFSLLEIHQPKETPSCYHCCCCLLAFSWWYFFSSSSSSSFPNPDCIWFLDSHQIYIKSLL